jgi:hypothetical protein
LIRNTAKVKRHNRPIESDAESTVSWSRKSRIDDLIAKQLERPPLSAKSVSAIGFLTVVEDQQHGHCGGYLLLNTSGRPLEFHCTAPVKPNRAQEVLYGPTLNPYLHGELIARTLVERAKVDPDVVCVDLESVLPLRSAISIPVTLVVPQDAEKSQTADEFDCDSLESKPIERASSQSTDQRLRIDRPHNTPAGLSHLHRFTCAGASLAVSLEFAEDETSIRQRLEPHSSRLDLSEPFERIREAVMEARGSGR